VNKQNLDDFSSSLLELFRLEAENQTAILTGGLLELERSPGTPQQLQGLLRALHSLKGAARIVNLQTGVRVAHAMEDCFVAAQNGSLSLGQTEIDLLLRGVDLLLQVSTVADGDMAAWEARHAADTRKLLSELANLAASAARAAPGPEAAPPGAGATRRALEKSLWQAHPVAARKHDLPERVLRLTAENLNRLLALAGESLVESRWLRPFSDSMQRLKRLQAEVTQSLETLRHALGGATTGDLVESHLAEAFQRLAECQQFLREKLDELDLYDRRSANLSQRLYLEVLRARMRPFGEGVRRFPRMVRDLARALGKEVRLEIRGDSTQVDRDILERLEGPLMHLLRNAVDHGCEIRAERVRAGKPPEALIRLEAHHSAGILVVTVSDDGAGIDPKVLRELVVRRKLTSAPAAEKLGEVELLGFLFLPGFTMKDEVTEISGRGMGLDVVQTMVKSVRGSIRVNSQPGRGTRFQLHLPLTLSVLRALLVSVGGEPYAFPLARISRTLKLPRDKIQVLEGRHYFSLGSQPVGLLTAHQVLDCEPQSLGDELSVVVFGERDTRYGLIVDRFLGERELVVQPLDPRLGKVRDIISAALMEDGSPVLIVDVEDMLSSIERLIAAGSLAKVAPELTGPDVPGRKRILAVDDSLTVRELERKLLAGHGYVADVAVDGLDAWNAVRAGRYDLVIADVDMPRMDGIELATLIKQDPHLKSVRVLIVSYKEGEEDRRRGLEAGADYYLTKGSFHDETLLQAVADLIGAPEP
jgi:two-component system sensor histidine kinase and response regulator WspE